MKALSDHRYLVLGGGFIGTNLSNALARAGARVSAYGRSLVIPGSLDPGVRWTSAELSNRRALMDALGDADIVFHLANSSTPSSANADPVGDISGSLVATHELLESCRHAAIHRIVFVSSGGTVYGVPATVPIAETSPTDPISAYGIHKLVIEKYLALYRHLYGLDYVVLRVSNPYGPLQTARNNQGVVAAYIRNALAGLELPIWGSGETVRDFIHIDDVVSALVTVSLYEGPFRLFNVGSGIGRSINSVVDDIEKVLERPLERAYTPSRAVDVPVNILDIRRIREAAGWAPQIQWIDGLRRTIEWMAGDGSREVS